MLSLSLPEAVWRVYGQAPGLRLVLRCWDSSTCYPEIEAKLKHLKVLTDASDAGCIVAPSMRNVEAFCEHLYGFDEVWGVAPAADVSKICHAPRFTSDRVRFNEKAPDASLVNIISGGWAEFAIADGVGVNVILGPAVDLEWFKA
jgi:hypothetical protein